MPLQSVELLLDTATDETVRALWQTLSDHGIRSQADHGGVTNAPHVTLAAVPVVTPAAEEALVPLAARLPLSLALSGPVLLGERRPALVLPVRAEAPLGRLHTDVRAALVVPGGSGDEVAGSRGAGGPRPVTRLPWAPHITLVRRLRPEDVEPASAVLAAVSTPDRATATALRRWDPDRRFAWLVG